MHARLTRNLWLVAAAAVLGGAAVATVAPGVALAGKDPVKIKQQRDEYRKNCKEKQKKYPYFDLSYGVDITKIDSRWAATETKEGEEKGRMFEATFSSASQAESSIDALVFKMLHNSLDGKSTFSYPFDRAGLSPKTSDKNGIVEGFYLDQLKTYKEPDMTKSVKPKKLKLGPCDLFASVTGNDPTSGVRERQDFFVWTSPNVTWVMRVFYKGIYVKNAEEFQDKVFDLMKATSELKNVPD